MGHLVREAELLNRSGRIAAADDRDGAALGHGRGDRDGAVRKPRELRNAHRAVPDNRARVLQRVSKELLGLGSDVETHPAVGNLVARDLLIIAVGSVLVAHAVVDRDHEFDALGLGVGHDLAGQLNLVLLQNRIADAVSQRLHKGIGHTAADNQGVHLVQQVGDDADLVRNLRAAEDGDKGALRIFQSAAHDLDFLLDQVAADGRQIIGQIGGRSLRTVGGAERVVDVDVGQRGKRLGKGSTLGLVLGGLLLVEADILQQHDFARLQRSGQRLGAVADHVVGKLDLDSQQLGEAGRHRLEGIGHVELTLRAAHVRAEDHGGTVLLQIFDGGQRLADTLVVGDFSVGQRHVEVAADKNLLALYVDVLNRLFVHSGHLVNHPFEI